MYRLVITPQEKQDGEIILTGEQHHYLHRVLRLSEGDRFIAMDGQGQSWIAQIKGKSVEILESILADTELSIAVTLMVALPKGNGFDEVVRCCTELGVSSFVPVISDRTLLKPSPQRVQRWRRIATEAAEQSERYYVPTIREPRKLRSALGEVGETEIDCYICVARGDAPHLLNCLSKQQQRNIIIATGPEGGFSAQEIESAIAAGFQTVSLGRRILRAITAPIVALSLAAAASESENLHQQNQ